MTIRKQQTIMVTRLMGANRRAVPTLINVDRIISANADDNEPHHWIRYEVQGGVAQNWRIKEDLTYILMASNSVYELVSHERLESPQTPGSLEYVNSK